MGELTHRFAQLVKDVRDGLPVLGERLLLLGSGPLPIEGAAGAALAIDERGDTVLIAALHDLNPETADQLLRQLVEIEGLSEQDLGELEQGPFLGRPLRERVGLVFGGPERAPASINSRQRLLLVVENAPSSEASRRLETTLQDRLDGVFASTAAGYTRILLSSPRQPAPARPVSRGPTVTTEAAPVPAIGTRPASYWLSLGIVLTGVALIVVAIVRAATPNDPSAEALVESPLRTIATEVTANVTQSYLVGQKRVLRLSDGRLLVLLPTTTGLLLSVDETNQGRTWRAPVEIGTPAVSLSVASDSSDTLHVVTSDGAQVAYLTLAEETDGWVAGPPLILDADTTSPVVDIAWDESTGLAHVVWIHQDGAASQPLWGSVGGEDQPRLIQTQVLADSGTELAPLVNVAVDSTSNAVVTYNHPDESGGWYSRSASPSREESEAPIFRWSDEEKIPVAAQYGAAALVVDERRQIHLVLRDDGAARLMYFNKTPGRDWSPGEPAVRGANPLEVDHPGLAVDASSRLIYLFFQRGGDRPEVQVVIRDPATGWEGPYQIVTETELPEGAMFPTTLAAATGPAIVLWTTAGDSPALQAVRVTAP